MPGKAAGAPVSKRERSGLRHRSVSRKECARQAEDVFAVQTEVVQRVQEALKVKLLAGTGPNATLAGTDNLEAYDFYLRARQFWNLRMGADIQRAVELFQQATQKDPKFAAAYAGLASAYALLSQYASLPIRETNPKAQSLDPLSPAITSSLGYLLLLAGRFDEALTELDKALELSLEFPMAVSIRMAGADCQFFDSPSQP